MLDGIRESGNSPTAKDGLFHAILATGAHALSLDDNQNLVSQDFESPASIFFDKALNTRQKLPSNVSIAMFNVRQCLERTMCIDYRSANGLMVSFASQSLLVMVSFRSPYDRTLSSLNILTNPLPAGLLRHTNRFPLYCHFTRRGYPLCSDASSQQR